MNNSSQVRKAEAHRPLSVSAIVQDNLKILDFSKLYPHCVTPPKNSETSL